MLLTASFAITGPNERVALVAKINSGGNIWRATSEGRFEGQPVGAAKVLCGVDIPAYHADLHAKVASGAIRNVTSLRTTDLPDAFDAATNPAWSACSKVIGDIRDQSACGCCWAFGAAEAASDRLCIATNGKVAVPLSAQDMCFCGAADGKLTQRSHAYSLSPHSIA